MHTMPPEPFKIKMIEPIRLIPRRDREKRVEEAHFCESHVLYLVP